jgi:uncharacterized protein (TIGR02284 family)
VAHFQLKKLVRCVCAAAIYLNCMPELSWIRVIKELIASSRAGGETYKIAVQEVKEGDLKYLFSCYALQRSKFALELEEVLEANASRVAGGGDGEVDQEEWIDLNALLSERGDHQILADCFRQEEQVLERYREAMEEALPEEVREIVDRQLREVEASCARLRELHFLSDSA